jgi:hypothetical protein
MAKELKSIKVNPNEIKVRDERIKDMITTTGGVVRVFTDKKKAAKADKVQRKAKYKKELD